VVRGPSNLSRFLVGTALAAALGVGLALALAASARREVAEERARRSAVVSTLALADVLSRAWGSPERVREAVARFTEQAVARARVVALGGARLEASTFPEDAGAKAAPRRLAREEKPLYDRGQRLRSAVATNHEEKSAQRPELEVALLPSSALSLAVPVEVGGEVVGILEVEAPPSPPAPRPSLAAALVALVAPVLAVALAALVLGGRSASLAIAAAAALGGALLWYDGVSLSTLAGDLGAAQGAVEEALRTSEARARDLLQRGGVKEEPPLAPRRWDADAYRRPLAPSGQQASERLAHSIVMARGAARRALAAVGAAALGLLLFVGLGGAGRVGHVLATHRQAYLYVLPAVLGTLVLVFFPFLYGIAISFTDQNIYNTGKPLSEIWIGLRNYRDILGDFGAVRRSAGGGLVFNYLNFYWTLLFTVVWTISNVTIGVTVGLALALVLNQKLRLRALYRVLLILPWAMPNYITALIWKGMFHQQFGVVNQIARLFGAQPIAWFDRPLTSFLTALATNGWLSFPFMMVVSLGALQSIPAEIYEAARVDGASRWQQFRAITLPSLRPALIPAVILSVVWTFNMFNIIYLVTQGEPGSSTEILVTQAYKFAFERYRYGYAAAYSTIIFGILLVYGAIQNRVSRATEAA
jgi:arabinogalactan oligomer/maltooligosaccharide transport system permease protein